jgi:proteic killer suppression protein
MEVEFSDADLDRLETDPGFTAGYGQAVVRGYRKAVQALRAARDVRDLYASKGLRFEQLKGKRQHQCSLRVNSQWRLIVEIDSTSAAQKIVLIEIADYH